MLGAGLNDAPGDAEIIKESSTADFMVDVVEASKQQTVIVDFWAPWCQPCKQLTPVLEKIVRSYAGKLRLVKVNVDQNQAIAAQLRVQSLPTVLAFQDGKPIDGFMGMQPESAIKEFAERVVGADEQDQIAAVIDSAEQALEDGDLQGAAEAFAAVLQVDPENADALAGLATCYLKSGDATRAEQTIGLVPPAKRTNSKVESVKASLELAKVAETAGPADELSQKIANDPNDHQSRIDLAMSLAARGDKSGAVQHLLEVVKRDRDWNDEAARKQLVKLFEAWGPKDPITNDGRRQLSSILFS
ncbi:MAG: thioredoxin [Alphaproteobacteria bacterium]|nr:thioredoxin [Alphaproteobacteria bacterium]